MNIRFTGSLPTKHLVPRVPACTIPGSDHVASESSGRRVPGRSIGWQVPKKSRWSNLQTNAKQSTSGKLIDDAMVPIEKEYPTLIAMAYFREHRALGSQ